MPVRFDRHLVVPNLWGGIVGRPGTMKSMAVQEALNPVNRLAATSRERFKAQLAVYAAKAELLHIEIDAIKAAIKQRVKNAQPLDDLETQLVEKQAELAEKPTERRYMTQDATVEKLGELLRDNPQGLLVFRDELAGWLHTLERSGREGDREFFLEAWNGAGDYTVDRIGRGTIYIGAVTVSIVGGIQPGKLEPYIAEALDEGRGADGLLQRLQLMVWPDSMPTFKPIDRWADSQAKDRAYKVFLHIDELDLSTIPTDEEAGIPAMRFTEDAQQVYDDYRSDLEQRLRGDDMVNTPAFESHLAKYRSLMPSIALLYHLVDVVTTNGPAGAVSETAATNAVEWCTFLEQHARKVYAAELAPGLSGARVMADKIKSGAVTDGQTLRDVYRHHWTGLRTAPDVSLAVQQLEQCGWARLVTTDTGGRPTEIVQLHPEIRKGNFPPNA